jgi:hypothetical protein
VQTPTTLLQSLKTEEPRNRKHTHIRIGELKSNLLTQLTISKSKINSFLSYFRISVLHPTMEHSFSDKRCAIRQIQAARRC